MPTQLEGLADAILDAEKKSLQFFLTTSNTSCQKDFDDLTFDNNLWVNPKIVAADGTQLAYYSSISNTWVKTRAKKIWINLQAPPASNYLEFKAMTRNHYILIG